MRFSPEYVTFCRGVQVPRQPLRHGDWYWVQGPSKEEGERFYGGWTPEGHVRLWMEPLNNETWRMKKGPPWGVSDGTFAYGTADWNDHNWKELDGPPIWLPLEGDWIELLREIQERQDPLFEAEGPFMRPLAYAVVFDAISRQVAAEAFPDDGRPDMPLVLGRLWREMSEGR
jgi:hypothetical protein